MPTNHILPPFLEFRWKNFIDFGEISLPPHLSCQHEIRRIFFSLLSADEETEENVSVKRQPTA